MNAMLFGFDLDGVSREVGKAVAAPACTCITPCCCAAILGGLEDDLGTVSVLNSLEWCANQ